MNDAENDLTKRQSNATMEQRNAARDAVFQRYMDVSTTNVDAPAPPPKGRFADPMAAIRAGSTGR